MTYLSVTVSSDTKKLDVNLYMTLVGTSGTTEQQQMGGEGLSINKLLHNKLLRNSNIDIRRAVTVRPFQILSEYAFMRYRHLNQI